MSLHALASFLPTLEAASAIYPARIVAFSGTTTNVCAAASGATSRIVGVTPPATKFPTGSREDASGYAFEAGDPVSYYGLPFTICKVELGGTITNLLTQLTATTAGKAVELTVGTGTAGVINWQLGYALQAGVSGDLIDVWLDIRPFVL